MRSSEPVQRGGDKLRRYEVSPKRQYIAPAEPRQGPTRYRLVPLTPLEVSRWSELIAPFEDSELFHQRPWLEYLAASRSVNLHFWRIVETGQALGYFCGASLRKGPFRVLGSPLKGWGTNFMGPVGRGQLNQPAFLRALDELAAEEDLAMIEIEFRDADGSAFQAGGFVPASGPTYVVSLTPGSTDPMWQSLNSTCRNRIRKAIGGNLTVERTLDPVIADEFFDQLLPIMLRQGMIPPYPRGYVHELVSHLMDKDLLFALRVRDTTGRIIAVGLFPHDGRTMYFWGGASLVESRKQCPNELMHWSAMQMAANEGLSEYNMCGPGAFKKKFGGSLIRTTRWRKSYSIYAELGRRLYQTYFRTRMQVQAWFLRSSTRFSGTERFSLRRDSL